MLRSPDKWQQLSQQLLGFLSRKMAGNVRKSKEKKQRKGIYQSHSLLCLELMDDQISLNFLLSPYVPMNNEVTFSFLSPFSLIDLFLHSAIFYHKTEEETQNCLVPSARTSRKLLHLIHQHVVSPCSKKQCFIDVSVLSTKRVCSNVAEQTNKQAAHKKWARWTLAPSQ